VGVISTSLDSIISYPETQTSSIPDSSIDNNPGIKKLKIKRVKNVRQQNHEDEKPIGDDVALDETRKWSGKYYITFMACFLFVVKC
jgi:phosphopantetheine adenylyltransferase